MKSKITNKITKKILVMLITIIMVSNFIMPNVVQAAEGGELFTPITELLLGITDRIFATLEGFFLGNFGAGDVFSASENKEEFYGYTRYSIRYTPKNIFSGKIPAFDIDFINEQKTTKLVDTVEYSYTEIKKNITWGEVVEQDAYAVPKGLVPTYSQTKTALLIFKSKVYVAEWKNTRRNISYIFVTGMDPEQERIGGTIGLDMHMQDTVEDCRGNLGKIEQDVAPISKDSTAGQLRSQIAKWYVGLRTFTLVGLLSVLIYLGIRIVLSSGSAQNQAKYKNMLKDWLVAVCIVFVLNYFMAFMNNMVGKITEIFVRYRPSNC